VGAKVTLQYETSYEYETSYMNGEQRREEWEKLCEQAAVEQDPERLQVLTREICRLLEEKEQALKSSRRP
jgi:hypothetical protein